MRARSEIRNAQLPDVGARYVCSVYKSSLRGGRWKKKEGAVGKKEGAVGKN